jgi:hypothetical protein
MRARIIVAALLAAAFSLPATAAEAAPAAVPAWSIEAFPAPTHFKPGEASGADSYQMYFTNSGGAVTDHGGPNGEIELTVTLPAGVGVKTVELEPPYWTHGGVRRKEFAEEACGHAPVGGSEVVTCRISDSSLPGDEPAKVAPGGGIYMSVGVTVPSCPGSASSCMLTGGSIGISGGGAAAVSRPLESLASEAEAEAGFNSFRAEVTDADGLPTGRSATHPYQFTTSFALNTALAPPDAEFPITPAEGDVKEIEVALPPGFAGNPTATPRCSQRQFNTVHSQVTQPNGEPSLKSTPVINACPNDSVVGTITIQQLNGDGAGLGDIRPIYNLVPPEGMPAQLGFQIVGLPIYIDTRLRSSEDYGITTYLPNVTETEKISAARVMIWGNPADESHDAMRGSCIDVGGLCPPIEPLEPFLRLPSSCQEQMPFTISFERWLHPGFMSATSSEPAPTACDAPTFTPSVEARSTTNSADSPSGLHFDLHNPQPQEAEAPGEADLRDATVILPEGLVVNPSSANGLDACSEAAVGYTGMSEGRPSFTGEPANCPDASKLGTVTIRTPLVDHPLPGAVYLARQGENPFNSLLAIYVAIDDPVTGVVVKLAGHVEPDPGTGRLTTRVEENPQLPFEDFELDFFGGPRAALMTPSTCDIYTTSTDLTPWTSPEGQDARPSDSFAITSGAGGGPCPSGALANAPSMEAGTVTPTAGAFSPLVFKVSREDGSARFGSITATLPEGLLGKLAGVPYCSQAQIAAATARSGEGEGALEQASPSCSEASQVGVVNITAGAGPEPYPVQGKVYLAGPYKDAPLSLAVVTPAIAGPFDLGTVVVRVALYINPSTAQISAVSDPIPSILDGIPLDVRSVSLNMDRAGFTFNPTSCEALSVTGQAISTLGQVAGLSNRFQVGGCAGLAFKPSLTASTVGKASKANGASLTVKVAQKPGEADIHKVDLTLPMTLPARLTTLQQACTEAQFNTNPANCPPGAFIGTATATTPILSVPLTGPAILVSHGGAAFPDVEFLLQANERGSIIQIDLDGKTDIKRGVTYSRFETVPDAPITSFETSLNQGPHSILGVNLPESAKYSLCGQKLTIPTMIIGQSGAQTKQATPISVTGCSTALSFTHKVKKKTLTLTVYAPAAGKITASGKGLTTQSKTAKGQEHLTITLKQKKAGKQKTTVKVLYTPSTGKDRKKQTRSVRLKFVR